jgi:hypothetical protein
MKAKPRGDLARAAVAAWGAAAWGRDRVVAVLTYCGLPKTVIDSELQRRLNQRYAMQRRRNERAQARRAERKEKKAEADAKA